MKKDMISKLDDDSLSEVLKNLDIRDIDALSKTQKSWSAREHMQIPKCLTTSLKIRCRWRWDYNPRTIAHALICNLKKAPRQTHVHNLYQTHQTVHIYVSADRLEEFNRDEFVKCYVDAGHKLNVTLLYYETCAHPGCFKRARYENSAHRFCEIHKSLGDTEREGRTIPERLPLAAGVAPVEALLVGMANEDGFISPMFSRPYFYNAVRFTREVRIIRDNAFHGHLLRDNVFYQHWAGLQLPPSMPKLELIGNGAFENCKDLTLPERLPKLREIGKNAFKSVDLDELPEMPSLQVIHDDAFSYNNIRTLPNMPYLRRIGNNAFLSNKRLDNLHINKDLKSIGESAFGVCDNLKRVTFEQGQAFSFECYDQKLLIKFNYSSGGHLSFVDVRVDGNFVYVGPKARQLDWSHKHDEELGKNIRDPFGFFQT